MTYNNQSNYNFKASIRSPVLDMSREICPVVREICRLKYVAHNQFKHSERLILRDADTFL